MVHPCVAWFTEVIPGLVIVGGLIGWMVYVHDEYGVGLFLLFLGLITTITFILFGGVLQVACNRCLDKYVEGCMRSERGKYDRIRPTYAKGDVVAHTGSDMHHGPYFTIVKISGDKVTMRELGTDQDQVVDARAVQWVWHAAELKDYIRQLKKRVEDKEDIDTFKRRWASTSTAAPSHPPSSARGYASSCRLSRRASCSCRW